MLQEISYHLIFGKPLIMYLGIATLTSFLITAFIGYTNLHNTMKVIPFKWHPKMAALSIALALIHGTLGVLAYL